MTEMVKPLAAQLRAARGNRTQAACAEACGVSANYYGIVERGEKLPSRAVLQRMANLTGATFYVAPESEEK